MEMEYATNGKANAALATGIIGTAGVGLGLLQGLLGGGERAVSRYELQQENEIAKLRSERDTLVLAQQTDAKLLDVWKEIDRRFKDTGTEIATLAANQAVINQKVTDNLAFVDSKINSTKQELLCYVNANFVPGKLVMPLDSICPPAQAASSTTATA